VGPYTIPSVPATIKHRPGLDGPLNGPPIIGGNGPPIIGGNGPPIIGGNNFGPIIGGNTFGPLTPPLNAGNVLKVLNNETQLEGAYHFNVD